MSRQFDRIVNAIPRAAVDLSDDRLAFFALTSKPELLIRDAIAWQLHSEFGASCRVAREWRRTDLAILSMDGRPLLLLEAKAMYTFDAVSPKSLADYSQLLAADRRKAELLADDETETVTLVLVTHVEDVVPPDLTSVVKYPAKINSAVAAHPGGDLRKAAFDLIIDELAEIGSVVRHVPMTNGTTFGIPVDVSAFVVGIDRGATLA